MRTGKRNSDSIASTANAEEVAVAGLGFIAGDDKLLARFLAITGIEAQTIRSAAKEPGFLREVLAFILAHQPTLDQFSNVSGIEPILAANAYRVLCDGQGQEWNSN